MKKKNIFKLTILKILSFYCASSMSSGITTFVYPKRPPLNNPDWIDVVDYKGGNNVSTYKLSQRAKAVGLLKFQEDFGTVEPKNFQDIRRCSGTLVANNLYMTAAHCFVAPDNVPWPEGSNGQPLAPFETVQLMEVRFNYRLGLDGTGLPTRDFKVIEVVDVNFGDLDYALLKLEGNPGRIYGTTPLSDEIPTSGQKLFMLHHPAGKPLKASFGTSDGMVLYNRDTDPLLKLAYNDIDTIGGSSGAGVLNSSGDLVAIHSGGFLTTDNMPHNYGTTITQILLESPNPIIPKLVANEPIVVKTRQIFEFKHPVKGNTPKSCSLNKTNASGGSHTEYSEYKLTCPDDSVTLSVTKTYNPNTRSSSCELTASPKLHYTITGSCTNWRVYSKNEVSLP